MGELFRQDLHFAVETGEGGEEILLDNDDDGVFYIDDDDQGWLLSTAGGGWGPTYRFAHTHSSEGNNIVTYTPDLPSAGSYRVETYYLASGNRTDNARYTVSDGTNEEVVLVNQRINNDGWVTLTEGIHLDPADEPFVSIDSLGTPIVVIADAVRWISLEALDPEFTIVTEIQGEGRLEGISDGQVASHGDVIDVQAVGENGFEFSHWEGNAWGSENPLNLKVGSNLVIRAVFTSAYSDWTKETFTESEREDPNLIAPDADPYGHGISNLLASSEKFVG